MSGIVRGTAKVLDTWGVLVVVNRAWCPKGQKRVAANKGAAKHPKSQKARIEKQEAESVCLNKKP